ncbi:MAG: hypothetical protein JJD98_02625 [Polaromonas sp.]|nr:hypothetical protein [Polaromonas sp.]
MKVITGKTKAWLTSYNGPDDLLGDPDKAVAAIALSNNDMTSSGWTFVGRATVTFECADNDTLVLNKVAALRGELQSVRANAEVAAGKLELKIQNLLAITNEVMA